MKYIERAKYIALLWCLVVGGSTSCTLQDKLADEAGYLKSVKFEVKTEWTKKSVAGSRTTNDTGLDAFIVKNIDGNAYELQSNADDLWCKDGQNGYSLVKHLEVGKYHFGMLKGVERVESYTEGNSGNVCYIVETPGIPQLEEVEIIHPQANGKLKDVKPLFLERGDGEFTKEMDLSKGMHEDFLISRTLDYAQSRIDVLLVKAEDNKDGTYNVLKEDPFGDKIENVFIQVSKLNNVCALANNVFSLKPEFPSVYEKNFTKQDFINFDYDIYKQNIQEEEIANKNFLKSLPSNALISNLQTEGSILLYPTEDADITLTINYRTESGIVPHQMTFNDVALSRNKVRLVVVRVVNEKFSTDTNIDIVDTMPQFHIDLMQEGFWN